jgi:ribosomal protein S12 methylthiotransferase
LNGAGFAFVTLGCAKNEADSERLERLLTNGGHRLVPADSADLVIVNTCGFIDAAKDESIAALLDVAEAVQSRGARVAAYGCLVQRYRDELAAELPEIDVFSGFDPAPLVDALESIAAARVGADDPIAAGPARRRSPRPLHAYVKISDGCDRHCSFCAIPMIKGTYEVVPPDEILELAGAALARGARELVLVGQDTARWRSAGYGGIDRLLGDLSVLGPLWLRLLYLQPEDVSEALLAALGRFAVPYLDIPLQHASKRVLGDMGRSGDGARFLDLLARVREVVPGAAVRSTFIVGFPGETDTDFEELLEFVLASGIAVGGVFAFDPQEGTRAASLGPRIADEICRERVTRLSEAVEATAAGFWSSLVGSVQTVLVERGKSRREGDAVGRIALQAPDVDGRTLVRGLVCRRGQTVRVRVDGVVGYDLVASAVGPHS